MRTPHRHWFLLAAALILGCALWLRLDQIDRRPFHADEAVQGYQTWQLLRGDGYTYDPTDKHGPLLYYFSAALTKLTGGSAETMTDRRLRGITLFAGLGTLVLLLAHASALSRPVALIATALIATAPLPILYDTYFVQEASFCFFTWALLFTAWKFLTQPTLPRAALLGLLAGLMQATKETSVLHFAALAVACALHFCRASACGDLGSAQAPALQNKPAHRSPLTASALLALAVFLLTYLAFYTAGFTRWSGALDGLLTYAHYFNRAGGSGHAQPWHYYFSLLWPHSINGARWGEPALLGLALFGFIVSHRKSAPSIIRVIAVFTVSLLLIYSAIPYKTPWLLLTPYVGLTLLAAHGLWSLSQRGELFRSRLRSAKPQTPNSKPQTPNYKLPTTNSQLQTPNSQLQPLLLLLVALTALLVTANLRLNHSVLDRYANDPRNPYLYQHTSADLARLVTTLRAAPPASSLAIVSPDHAWPLPWYLRDRAQVGYFTTVPDTLAAYDLALLDTRLDLPAQPGAQVFGLRPDVLLWLTRRQP